VDPVDGARSAAPVRAGRSDVVAVALIALVLCGAAAAYWFTSVVSEPTRADRTEHAGELISSMYDPPESAIENAIDKGDGQLFAGQATDPLVRRPEMVRGDAAEQAYRYQRPAYGWLGWVASGGRPGAVAVGLIGVTVLSAALLVLVAARWFGDRATDPRWALLLLLLPGVAIDLTWIGPEVLGTALVVLGLHRWLDVAHRTDASERALPVVAPPDWVAIACFAAAGLCRETLLLVPFVLVLTSAVTGRWRRAFGAAGSAVPYVLWVAFLRFRIGSWPQGSVDGRLSLVPFGGLADAAGTWARAEVAFAVLLLGLAVVALARGRGSGLRPVIAANLALAATLGEPVWHRFPDFTRVLLPLGALSLLVVVPSLLGRPARSSFADQVQPEGATAT
jgi:hypothetical protein